MQTRSTCCPFVHSRLWRHHVLAGTYQKMAWRSFSSRRNVALQGLYNKRPLSTGTQPPANMERTFLMIKPDGVHRGLVGEIIKRFETKGYKLVSFKFMQATDAILSQHYAEHEGKPFFEGLLQYIMSGPVVPMVWEGKEVISTGRSIIGATNPLKAPPGTIRGDYGLVMGRNIIHGSDSEESAQREISIWFTEEELVDWVPNQNTWIYE